MQHFENAGSDPDLAHAMYRDDAVLEFPQSGERFVGVENFREWRSSYPASTTFEIQEVMGRPGSVGCRADGQLRPGPCELRGQHHRATRRQDRARVDLRDRRLGSTGVARPLEVVAVGTEAESALRMSRPLMLATLTERREFGDDWLLERKFDGERAS